MKVPIDIGGFAAQKMDRIRRAVRSGCTVIFTDGTLSGKVLAMDDDNCLKLDGVRYGRWIDWEDFTDDGELDVVEIDGCLYIAPKWWCK